MRHTLTALVGLLLAAGVLAAPPEATMGRLEQALKALDEGLFVGSYRVTTKAVVSKPDGSAREERTEILEFTQSADGKTAVVVVSATKDGQDVTAQRRESLAKSRAKRDKKDTRPSLRLPVGEDLARFEFGPTEGSGVLTANFRPRQSSRKEEDMAQGTLAWDEATGDPLWIEASYVDPPTGVKEIVVRLEIGRTGDLLHLRRTTSRGVAGMLWIQRAFDIEMTISDLAPAPSAARTQ